MPEEPVLSDFRLASCCMLGRPRLVSYASPLVSKMAQPSMPLKMTTYTAGTPTVEKNSAGWTPVQHQGRALANYGGGYVTRMWWGRHYRAVFSNLGGGDRTHIFCTWVAPFQEGGNCIHGTDFATSCCLYRASALFWVMSTNRIGRYTCIGNENQQASEKRTE